jgi:hypothetical protein
MSVAASNTVLQFTDTGAQLRTLQCNLDDVEYASSRNIEKEETFCAVTKAPGNPDNSITVTGFYSATANEAHQVFNALKQDTTARLYKYGPGGSASGAVLLSGVSYLVDYTIKATAGGSVKISAKFEIDGNDVATTWP